MSGVFFSDAITFIETFNRLHPKKFETENKSLRSAMPWILRNQVIASSLLFWCNDQAFPLFRKCDCGKKKELPLTSVELYCLQILFLPLQIVLGPIYVLAHLIKRSTVILIPVLKPHENLLKQICLDIIYLKNRNRSIHAIRQFYERLRCFIEDCIFLLLQ